MSRLRAAWWRIRDGLWFLPALLVAGAMLLAVALAELDGLVDAALQQRWPRLFGASAEGARGLLSAIATSMLTVAGTVFSVTLAVLSLAASQYSPRVLRSFMADRPTQLVLGVFVAVFVYCLIVLRTVRGGETPVVPALAVLGGIVLAIAAVGFLVFFIHHLATSIEASSILARITRGTVQAVEELFPEELGEEADEAGPQARVAAIRAWTAVPAKETGYIVSLDSEALLAFARGQGRVVRMAAGVGQFVVAGEPLACLEGDAPVSEAAAASLNRCYSFDRQRTLEQDAAFGVQQIVDVCLKALSPGINDQSTATLGIDRLSEVLVKLARRRVENRFRRDGEALRVIAVGPAFGELVDLAFADLRLNAAGKPAVLHRLLESLERIAGATSSSARRGVLAAQAARIAECAGRSVAAPYEREQLLARAAAFARLIAADATPGRARRTAPD
jgi:uncharacterized membrane protein